MAKLKKVIEIPEEEPKITAETVKAAPESYLVRWKGGEEKFDSLAKAEFAVRTHVEGRIV